MRQASVLEILAQVLVLTEVSNATHGAGAVQLAFALVARQLGHIGSHGGIVVVVRIVERFAEIELALETGHFLDIKPLGNQAALVAISRVLQPGQFLEGLGLQGGSGFRILGHRANS